MDVSGSMEAPNKLPLLKSCFLLLADQLKTHDKVAIVVYAGAAGLILPSTAGNNKPVIKAAIERLSAGGTTAGGQGIRLAYHIAELGFIKGGNNRIILATDGDFNIGVSSTSELVRLVEEKRRTGIYLTVLGFGTGNLKDSRMESLADRGNGNYFYIDNILEGKKVFVDEMTATLYTIAKDVKIQAEFNPAVVKAYRLIGYENRLLENEDFKDDTKDAGELGFGHTVTALYEWIPAGSKEEIPETDPLKFQETRIKADALKSREIAWVKLRYKKPDEDQSRLITHVLTSHSPEIHSDNFYFSTAVALWGMLLRDSPHKNNGTYQRVMELAERGKGKDTNGYRRDFIHLVRISHQLVMKQMAANAAVSIRMVP
jgi:Ca-activated chloride channel family protein